MSTPAFRQERVKSHGLPLGTAALLAAAAISVLSLLAINDTDELGWDFRYGYLRAAELVLNGESPYPDIERTTIEPGDALYVYPPQLAVALAPFSVLPDDVVVWVAFFAGLAGLMGALALLGVRDVRCYAALLAWGSTSNALEMTNVSVFLVPALAVAWRLRAATWSLATTLGLAISTKVFLWPLVVWELATRRYRAAVLSVGIGLAVTAVAWAVIGFAGLTAYPELLRRFSDAQGEGESYSIVALVVGLGLGASLGQALALVVGAALVVASARFGRARDDERSFVAAIGATLAITPVAWLHYFVLLAVPLAIVRPRFSAIWLLPIVLWVCPRDGNGDVWQLVVPVTMTAVVLWVLLANPVRRAGAVESTA